MPPAPDPWASTSREEIYRAAAAELSRRRLFHFLRFGWHVTEPGVELETWWHIEAICDHVQWVLEGWLRRRKPNSRKLDPEAWTIPQNLLINAPPGVIKSRIVSVYAPVWMWLHAPEWRVIALSVNPRVAQRDADYSRTLIQSSWFQSWFQPTWSLREDKDAVSCYGNTAGGQRDSLGWSSRVVGQRADAILPDDPNDPEKAYSDTDRRGINNRWTKTHANRVNDARTSIRMGIQQRVHFDDWSATFLKQAAKNIVHLRLPTEYVLEKACRTPMPTPTGTWCDPRTTPGEVLHPARFPEEVVAYEKRLGPLRWSSQHQQDPDDEGSSMFQRRWFRWWKPDGVEGGTRPEGCAPSDRFPAVPLVFSELEWFATSTDAAFKETDDGSRVSIQVWAGKGPDRFLLDVVTKHMGLQGTLDTLRALKSKWDKHADGNWRHFIEDKANGTAAVEMLQREMSGVIPVEPKGGKESRAYAAQPIVYGSNVFLPEGAEFLEYSIDGGEGWLPEVCRFPNGDKDDQPDAMTQLLIEMQHPHDFARTLALSTL